ncbi:MAG: 2-oxoglutarate dehydrogenase, E2 component, dihydrolipoamide succinyltransferase [Bryobacteraceae bacterium]|nr:2-oxoglutarate dehydrogenase, E2 component, dihydrolipoamide succinyltransferase [Bryobacteraceae bacterium]
MADVVMPQMGESIVEGTLTKWLKKVGDKVERDEPLFEISTDKVDTEIPSPAAGTLTEILAQEGDTVQVNAVVARVGEGDGAAAAAPAAEEKKEEPKPDEPPKEEAKQEEPKEEPKPAEAETPAEAKGDEEEFSGPVSPLVRRMARENNIDLKTVKGTGAGGRITRADLEAVIGKGAPAETAPAAKAEEPARPAAEAKAEPAPATKPVPPRTRVEPMSIMRAKIAEHMIHSKRTSAHVTTVHRVDMTKIAQVRAKAKDDFQQRYGFGLTFLPFITRAAVEALRQFPVVNASIEGTNVLYHNEVNIGIAVALENGLIVPVIRGADEKNIVGLQRSIVDLASRARSRQLKPDEVQGGTFSITNFGSFGSLFATPVINQPQVAILGVGAIEKAPVVIGDAIAIRSMAYLALTFDHRLIDGALADQFCQKVKAVLESWSDQIL